MLIRHQHRSPLGITVQFSLRDYGNSVSVRCPTQHLWGGSAHRPNTGDCTLAQCAWSAGGLQKDNPLSMGKLRFTSPSTPEHHSAYFGRPSWTVNMEVPWMFEDVLAEGDGT